MKKLLGFMLAIFFIGCIAGCSKNKDTVAIPKPNLPTAIEKVNKNMTGNILKSQELEDELNYRRTDRSEPLYVSITDRSPIEVFKEVGNTSVENSKGKYINIKMAEVGDKRSINGEDWLLLRIIYPISEEEKGKLKKQPKIDKKLLWKAPQNVWVQSRNNIVVNPNLGTVYKLSQDREFPKFFKGNWRFAYASLSENNYWSYFINVDSIVKKENKIYFDTLLMPETMNFLWKDSKKTFELEVLPGSVNTYYLTTYCFDTNKNYIYEAAKTYYDRNGKITNENNYERKWHKADENIKGIKEIKNNPYGFKAPEYDPFDKGQYLVRNDKNHLVWELSKNKPVFDDTPNLIFTAFFEVLEGR